ncbi:MAG TPA: DUF1858 domain-containing protein [Caldilineaceae bacterium]|nr:DUF1858 domain-containing protein [Caldilineaceae bacterium]
MGAVVEGGLTVAEVLSQWPATIPVFLRYHTACVGCVMARFETLDEVAAIYGLDQSQFVAELRRAATEPPVYPSQEENNH